MTHQRLQCKHQHTQWRLGMDRGHCTDCGVELYYDRERECVCEVVDTHKVPKPTGIYRLPKDERVGHALVLVFEHEPTDEQAKYVYALLSDAHKPCTAKVVSSIRIAAIPAMSAARNTDHEANDSGPVE